MCASDTFKQGKQLGVMHSIMETCRSSFLRSYLAVSALHATAQTRITVLQQAAEETGIPLIYYQALIEVLLPKWYKSCPLVFSDVLFPRVERCLIENEIRECKHPSSSPRTQQHVVVPFFHSLRYLRLVLTLAKREAILNTNARPLAPVRPRHIVERYLLTVSQDVLTELPAQIRTSREFYESLLTTWKYTVPLHGAIGVARVCY